MPKLHEKHRPAEDRSDFVARMRECEQRAGSRRALALATGIPQSTIRGYTARTTEPPRDILISIAKAAGVSALWLVTGEGASEPEQPVAFEPAGTSVHDDGIKEIAAAVAKRYGVSVEFAQTRLAGSKEISALETAMKEGISSHPIPVAGTDKQKIWGVLSKADLEKASPGSMLENIEVYQVRTKRLAPHFLKGDWALVDTSKQYGDGRYCVVPKHGSDVEVREITGHEGQTRISKSMDREESTRHDDHETFFSTIGRLVGAIRFVAGAQDGKP